MAAALRHQLCRRHFRRRFCADFGGGDADRAYSCAGRTWRRGRSRRLPLHGAVTVGRRHRLLPHRRPVQPLCVVRGDADRLVRPARARRAAGAARWRGEVWLHQFPRHHVFLLALGLLYGLLGTLNMADIMRVAPEANPAAMAGVAALLLLAFGMKAAAFPVNAWLPASYHTPPAVVSALFGGLLTKVGIYAMLRALVVLLPASRDLLEPVLVVIAVATLLIAPLGAIAETNLRRAIGFFVIGGVGSVLVGIALPSLAGVSGAGLYVFHAILTMTAFYLVAGLVERRTGQSDTRRMGGLYATTAPVSILFFVLVLATAGVPPFLGFWPKLLLLQAGLGEGSWLGGLVAIALLVNAVLTLIAGSRLWAHIFWRPAPEGAATPASASVATWLRVGTAGVLVGIVVAVGLWPNAMFEVLRLGAPDMLDPSRYVAAIGLAGGTP
ncbi:hypothetical protein FPZ08_01845 [Devosia ginsengisoli]|uniref:NADH:quinone oxidoreductase/Mrp antiporter transmembrane domain-containing protein n=2 Tax=Devosia ginsengisoli TaxID=400770 RepID=A0A5B8LNP3_9HYPH|nr:hypothetical protein FPZ08_01845 [Devosia ginsengisoli]